MGNTKKGFVVTCDQCGSVLPPAPKVQPPTFLVEARKQGGFYVHVYYRREQDRKAINKDLREMAHAKWVYQLRRWAVFPEHQQGLRKLMIKYGQVD